MLLEHSKDTYDYLGSIPYCLFAGVFNSFFVDRNISECEAGKAICKGPMQGIGYGCCQPSQQAAVDRTLFVWLHVLISDTSHDSESVNSVMTSSGPITPLTMFTNFWDEMTLDFDSTRLAV